VPEHHENNMKIATILMTTRKEETERAKENATLKFSFRIGRLEHV